MAIVCAVADAAEHAHINTALGDQFAHRRAGTFEHSTDTLTRLRPSAVATLSRQGFTIFTENDLKE